MIYLIIGFVLVNVIIGFIITIMSGSKYPYKSKKRTINSNFNSFSTFASKINKNNEFNPEANMNEMNKAELGSSDNSLKTSAAEGHEQNEPKNANTKKEDKKITIEGEVDEA